MSRYKTIHNLGVKEITINKSKFIGYAKPVKNEEEAVGFIDEIKNKHKDATHNVYAYVIGQNINIQRYTDDGEPQGTAGMPILNVIKQENLKNVVVVVTRYFGGIKLGTGGLARAYTKSAKIGLESGQIVEKIEFYEIGIKIDYTLLGKVENALMNSRYIINSKEYLDKVDLSILCIKEDIDKFKNFIMNLTSANCNLKIKGERYISVKDNEILK